VKVALVRGRRNSRRSLRCFLSISGLWLLLTSASAQPLATVFEDVNEGGSSFVFQSRSGEDYVQVTLGKNVGAGHPAAYITSGELVPDTVLFADCEQWEYQGTVQSSHVLRRETYVAVLVPLDVDAQTYDEIIGGLSSSVGSGDWLDALSDVCYFGMPDPEFIEVSTLYLVPGQTITTGLFYEVTLTLMANPSNDEIGFALEAVREH
jgi:hypothetical protein